MTWLIVAEVEGVEWNKRASRGVVVEHDALEIDRIGDLESRDEKSDMLARADERENKHDQILLRYSSSLFANALYNI